MSTSTFSLSDLLLLSLTTSSASIPLIAPFCIVPLVWQISLTRRQKNKINMTLHRFFKQMPKKDSPTHMPLDYRCA